MPEANSSVVETGLNVAYADLSGNDCRHDDRRRDSQHYSRFTP
jgi:hypothetical protein